MDEVGNRTCVVRSLSSWQTVPSIQVAKKWWRPRTTDKFTRALSWANLAEEGKVILVRDRWIEDFLDEICTFPNSQHDDQLDAVSLAVQMLQKRKQIAFAF